MFRGGCTTDGPEKQTDQLQSSCRSSGAGLLYKSAVTPPFVDSCAVEEVSSEVLKSSLSSERAWATLDLLGDML